MNKHPHSVIYINYSPYENAGHILDYLIENYEYVFLITLAFHKLNRKIEKNKITIYRHGTIIEERFMYYMYVPQSLEYFLIPVRSFANFIQIVLNCIKLKSKYGLFIVFKHFLINHFIIILLSHPFTIFYKIFMVLNDFADCLD